MAGGGKQAIELNTKEMNDCIAALETRYRFQLFRLWEERNAMAAINSIRFQQTFNLFQPHLINFILAWSGVYLQFVVAEFIAPPKPHSSFKLQISNPRFNAA